MDRLAVVRPHICTCDSHIERKVDARHLRDCCGRQVLRLFWVRTHTGIAETSVEINSPGGPPSPRRAADYDCVQNHPTDRYGVLDHASLNGRGRFTCYLFRFNLWDSPYCACDPAKIQDVLHVFEECDMFLRERAEMGVRVTRRHFCLNLWKTE
ncbi:hypothetical protein EVAR_76971_1 [Eumeta japonica]|uniref:Uncharacterized protein n=1 Tax=Eumeta variegata TaxID=151549 RepID=A0A4C1SHZ7_EUMVA|nr:hypothetical protein EVAR_76971_1 [Eumeta japonica]